MGWHRNCIEVCRDICTVTEGRPFALKIFDTSTMRTLGAALDVASARHMVISNNVTNVNTPGYKAADIDFESAMDQALGGQVGSGSFSTRVTRPRHIQARTRAASASPIATCDDSVSMRVDGNSVDMDIEMARMAENSLMYNTAAQLIQNKFSLLKYVISEGRR